MTKLDPAAANAVLVFSGEGGHGVNGGFTDLLIQTAMKADRDNLRRIALGFPEIAWAVDAYKNDPDGIARLREAAAKW